MRCLLHAYHSLIGTLKFLVNGDNVFFSKEVDNCDVQVHVELITRKNAQIIKLQQVRTSFVLSKSVIRPNPVPTSLVNTLVQEYLPHWPLHQESILIILNLGLAHRYKDHKQKQSYGSQSSCTLRRTNAENQSNSSSCNLTMASISSQSQGRNKPLTKFKHPMLELVPAKKKSQLRFHQLPNNMMANAVNFIYHQHFKL